MFDSSLFRMDKLVQCLHTILNALPVIGQYLAVYVGLCILSVTVVDVVVVVVDCSFVFSFLVTWLSWRI